MTSIGHRPSGSWRFDHSVAAVFDDMLPRSIPGYDDMRRTMVEVVGEAVRDRADATVLNVGASLCGTARALARPFPGLRVVGIDNSPDMVDAAIGYAPMGCSVQLRDVVEEGLPDGPFDAVVWCFVLQFVPVEHRARLLVETRRRLKPGGVVFVTEKVQGETAEAQERLTAWYHARKREAGYSQEDIDAKARALRYAMATLSEADNVAMFHRCGFTVQPVWRALCFAGWALYHG
jgi:tRNA (cmo5U34)-methyltransferase